MTSMRIDGDKAAKVWAKRFETFALAAMADGVEFSWLDDVLIIEKDGVEFDMLVEAE